MNKLDDVEQIFTKLRAQQAGDEQRQRMRRIAVFCLGLVVLFLIVAVIAS